MLNSATKYPHGGENVFPLNISMGYMVIDKDPDNVILPIRIVAVVVQEYPKSIISPSCTSHYYSKFQLKDSCIE